MQHSCEFDFALYDHVPVDLAPLNENCSVKNAFSNRATYFVVIVNIIGGLYATVFNILYTVYIEKFMG